MIQRWPSQSEGTPDMRTYMRNTGRPRVVEPRGAAAKQGTNAERDHEEQELDEALDDSFPASDPVASLRFD
jgi:hypothetical protein